MSSSIPTTQIHFTLTCAGDISSFNATALDATLRERLGCWARNGCLLQLSVSAASVLITGTIFVADAATASNTSRAELVSTALETLLEQDTEELSRVVGATVEAVGHPTLVHPADSALALEPEPSHQVSIELLAGVLAGMLAGVLIGCTVLLLRYGGVLVIFRARCKGLWHCLRRCQRRPPQMLLRQFDVPSSSANDTYGASVETSVKVTSNKEEKGDSWLVVGASGENGHGLHGLHVASI